MDSLATMVILMGAVLVLAILDLAASRFGHDSRYDNRPQLW